jgi:hypothetical protein
MTTYINDYMSEKVASSIQEFIHTNFRRKYITSNMICDSSPTSYITYANKIVSNML